MNTVSIESYSGAKARMPRGKALLAVVAAAGLTFGMGAVAANAAPGNGDSNPGNKITICHATSSVKNPFVVNSPNANGVVSGHAGESHQDARDIIPAFWYTEDGVSVFFPGQNWDGNGQDTYNNGCVAGGGGGVG